MPVMCHLGHENPDGAAFCDQCGESLDTAPPTVIPSVGTQPCPSCGTPNPVGGDFCSNCGTSLQGGAAPAIVPPSEDQTVMASPRFSPRLIVEADEQEFDLGGKDNIVIGREDAVSNIYPDIDLTPHGGEEGGVSRKHARIFVENGQYMLEDENSTNLTFLNRQKLAPKTPTPLRDNDEIKLGRIVLRFKNS